MKQKRWNGAANGLGPVLEYTLAFPTSLVVISLSEPDLLFLTNGHGEDAIAGRLADEFRGLGLRLAGVPLVGEGHALREAGIEVLGPAREAPSGGWGLRRPDLLLADLRRGWLGALGESLAAARAARPHLAVAVGDLLPAAFASLAGLPAVLVGCNKTDWYSGWGESYLAIEVAALRVWGTEVLPRDRRTHERLSRLGLRSTWAGNVMPDLIGALPPPGEGIALLPGSRADARANLPLMLEALRSAGLLAPAKQDPGRSGHARPAAPAQSRPGQPAAPPAANAQPGPVYAALAPGMDDLADLAAAAGVPVVGIEQALAGAGIVLGTAGTASEVAAAHGRPVIAFAGPGPQYTPYFAARQKDLLGDALVLCERDPEAIGAAARLALADAAFRTRAACAGRERVGEPGAAREIAQVLHARLACRDS